jgi:hypothetical protein
VGGDAARVRPVLRKDNMCNFAQLYNSQYEKQHKTKKEDEKKEAQA